MKYYVFTVYDAGAEAYLPPWIMPKLEMARRIFGDCCNSSDHQFAAHPEDYTLFVMGMFDDETAEFIPYANGKQSLGVGVEYVRKEATNAKDGTNGLSSAESSSISDDASILPESGSEDSAELVQPE